MLPSNLLRAKISRGRIRPVYATLDPDIMALASKVTGVFSGNIGKTKGALSDRLREIEGDGCDYKLVRGLSTLLERRCVLEADSATNPIEARRLVFEDASRVRASSLEDRDGVIQRVSATLGLSPPLLDKTIFSDMEDELILRDFNPLSPQSLIQRYNLSLLQTLLFKSLRLEFSASGNWKSIFREVKRLGLIYSVERADNGEGYRVTVDGPLSLFKMTERYGTSTARLVPKIIVSDSWTIRAEILARRKGRVYTFEANEEEKHLLAEGDGAAEKGSQNGLYDSSLEEKFARSFISYNSGWILRREPEPLIAGRHVLIPDFSFEKHGVKVYLEIVGFWTSDYLERKISKLSLLTDVDMIVAVDESLACSRLARLKNKMLLVYFKGEVTLKPVIEHLKQREASILGEQAALVKTKGVALKGDVVSLEEIAKENHVSLESVRKALEEFTQDGYVKTGDQFISKARLDEVGRMLEGVERLTDALGIIEASGLKEEAANVLEALGYTSVWEGMEMDKVRIVKSRSGKR
jgi:predicted nuclease of restriction endonuclease-like RecB superfamily